MIKINEAILIKLAGVRAFGRGLSIFEDRCVSDFEATDNNAQAVVHGEWPHDVRLQYSDLQLEGACDCPDSDGFDFCEHCVAVALALQQKKGKPRPYAKKRAMTAIRRHLSTLSSDELLEEFMAVIGGDRVLRDDYLQKARFASGRLSYADIRKMIDDIEPDGELWEVRDVRAYIDRLESLLQRIAQHADEIDPVILLRTVEHTIRQYRSELVRIVDIAECGEQVIETIGHLHRRATGRLSWSTADIASYLVDQGEAEGWHPFGWEPDLYASEMGEGFGRALIAEIEARLDKAAQPTSAASADQVEATDYLEGLLDNLLAAGDMLGMDNHAERSLCFRIELTDIAPAIWREFEVPASYTFWDLHVAIQDVMGWRDCHLHAFRIREPLTRDIIEIGIPFDEEFGDSEPTLPGWHVPVLSYLNELGQEIEYLYDFGDNWTHRVQLLANKRRESGSAYPKCLAGERACPPEDCGGTWGYQTFLEALADPTHERHNDMLRWIGGPFDSEQFDAGDVKFDDPRERWQIAFRN